MNSKVWKTNIIIYINAYMCVYICIDIYIFFVYTYKQLYSQRHHASAALRRKGVILGGTWNLGRAPRKTTDQQLLGGS